MVIYTLSDRAARWLKSQENPTRTIERLIELAADPLAYLSLKIAKALNLPHPDRVAKTLGAPVTVADEALTCLRNDGLTDSAIGRIVGLSRGQVGKRIKKIKKEEKMNFEPISVHLNKDIDRLIVLNSSRHEQDKLAKETLIKLGYQIQTTGNIYTIAGPNLDRIKTGLDIAYGITEDDRSGEPE